MQTRWLGVLLGSLYAMAPVAAQEASSSLHAETKRLLKVSGFEGQVRTGVDTLGKAFAPLIAKQMRADWIESGNADLDPRAYDDLSAAVLDEYRSIFTAEAMADLLVPIYEKHFTAEEIRALIQFYESPVGAKLAATTPTLLVEAGEAGGRLSREILAKMQTPEFRAKAARILAQYSEPSNPAKKTAGEQSRITVVVPRTPDSEGASAVNPADAAPVALDPAHVEKLPSGQVRISGAQATAHRLPFVGPVPAYPWEAKEAGIEGSVQVEATIGTDGRVIKTTLISGHRLLAADAIDVVSNWVFHPMTLNGQPVEVVTQVTVTFSLAK